MRTDRQALLRTIKMGRDWFFSRLVNIYTKWKYVLCANSNCYFQIFIFTAHTHRANFRTIANTTVLWKQAHHPNWDSGNSPCCQLLEYTFRFTSVFKHRCITCPSVYTVPLCDLFFVVALFYFNWFSISLLQMQSTKQRIFRVILPVMPHGHRSAPRWTHIWSAPLWIQNVAAFTS